MAGDRRTEFSHDELSLLVFVLEGCPDDGAVAAVPSCKEACPVISNIDEAFGGGAVASEKILARHLSNHLREGLIECGLLELAEPGGVGFSQALSHADSATVQRVNARLRQWRCEIKLDCEQLGILSDAVRRLPRSAWLTMPRTLWRLRRKLNSARERQSSGASQA
jgi:hypothetical protein